MKPKILTIDDDPDILDVLDITLSDEYEIAQAHNGQEGLEKVKQFMPDVIICDCVMPVMNGKDFCKELKKDMLLQHIPVIMVTGKGEVRDRISGIESGVDDYLVKPFDPNELLARIKMILRRTIRSLDANPLTHLPGNTTIMEELQKKIDKGRIFAVGYADLDKFKAYNDTYGFEKGDEVIKESGRIILEAVHHVAGSKNFVGHIGGDDFVFIADNDIIEKVCEEIIRKFDEKVPDFYTEEDYRNGFIASKDRQGNDQQYGLLAISIGIVSNQNQKIKHVVQIGEIGAELKKFAKSFKDSKYVRDQRAG